MAYFEFSNRLLGPFGRFEWALVSLSVILTTVGLALIYSATASLGGAERTFVVKQFTWFCLSLVMLAGLLLVDYKFFEKWTLWIYLAVILALLVVWAIGRVTAGSRRWIDLGLMRFQPSEFAKLAVVLALAKCLGPRFLSLIHI